MPGSVETAFCVQCVGSHHRHEIRARSSTRTPTHTNSNKLKQTQQSPPPLPVYPDRHLVTSAAMPAMPAQLRQPTCCVTTMHPRSRKRPLSRVDQTYLGTNCHRGTETITRLSSVGKIQHIGSSTLFYLGRVAVLCDARIARTPMLDGQGNV